MVESGGRKREEETRGEEKRGEKTRDTQITYLVFWQVWPLGWQRVPPGVGG